MNKSHIFVFNNQEISPGQFKRVLKNQYQVIEIKEIEQCKKCNPIRTEKTAYLNPNREFHIPDAQEYKKAYRQTEIALSGGLTLLIYGETGVGKSLMVSSLHKKLMMDKPLVSLDCGSLCPSLLESELFGYEKGAFTGADKAKPGKIEMANGGILFLDEIGSASLDVQAKLLRVLQEKKLCRLGSNKEKTVDFMLISATNRDLISAISKNEFKPDFYYRIKQIEITLPPIRNNLKALKQFTEYFIYFYNHKYKTNFKFDHEFWDYIQAQKWPGNLRELELDIQKIVFTFSLGEDYKIYLHKEANLKPEIEDINKLKINLKEMEKEKILYLLQKNFFNITATAREYKIPRTTLFSRMKKYGLAGG